MPPVPGSQAGTAPTVRRWRRQAALRLALCRCAVPMPGRTRSVGRRVILSVRTISARMPAAARNVVGGAA